MRRDMWAAALAATAGVVLAAAGLAGSQDAKPKGYLGASAPDIAAIVPPAPAAGDPRDEADRRAFRDSRAQAGDARWRLAVADLDYADMLGREACALGARLTPKTAPRTHALFARAGVDVGQAVFRPKAHFKRVRPYQRDSGATCDPHQHELDRSFDYPSGHATLGWAYGLILAELAPDRATQVLTRARIYGESRAVCGVHSQSAVEAARTGASALVAALHGSAEFRRDLEAARREIAAARRASAAPDAAACAAEAAGMAAR